MNEYKIQLTLPVPDAEVAKQVANEAQQLIDEFGYKTFLQAVAFMRSNPDMVGAALSMIRR